MGNFLVHILLFLISTLFFLLQKQSFEDVLRSRCFPVDIAIYQITYFEEHVRTASCAEAYLGPAKHL